MSQPIVCPECGQSDLIRQVTAIYTEGTSGVSAGHDSGSTQSGLASRLAPPSKPVASLWGWRVLAGLIVAAFMLASQVNALADTGSSIGEALFLTVLLPLAIYYLHNKAAEGKVSKWEEEMRRWQRLYYCARDDLVFDPGASQIS